MLKRVCVITTGLMLACSALAAQENPSQRVLRAGIIGADTSHVPAFTKLFNDPKASGDLARIKVVAAFPGGSPDLPSSRDRVQGYTEELRKMNVEIVDSIPALLAKVDVVLLESVDGRPHLEQVKPVFKAGKPVFIDKPLAGSLADCIAIVELGKKHNVPWFSSSSLRFSPGIIGMRNDPKVGQVMGCDAFGPCPTEEHHPDLFWYGVHGCEILYTIMGPGCTSVTRTRTEGTEVVVGVWNDGRIGTFRGIRKGKSDYGATVFGAKAVVPSGRYEGYKPLAEEIAKFFLTGKPPIAPEETLELFAFMEAADESKRQNGAAVSIESVMAKAREQAKARMGD